MTSRLALAVLIGAGPCITSASTQSPVTSTSSHAPETTISSTGAVTTADFAGTWNIEFMSHQIALVIEPGDATHVTATMMMMGRDVALKGELSGRTLTLVGDPAGATTAAAPSPSHGSAAGTSPAPAGGHPPPAKPITVTLEEDGTITGQMMTTRGPGTWTGERLKKRQEGACI